MSRTTFARRSALATAAAVAAVSIAGGSALAAAGPTSQLYVPQPQEGARLQIAQLTAAGQKTDAALIRDLINTPQAVWLTGDASDKKTEDTVKRVRQQAAGKGQIPVFVIYDITYRDCGQYSSGGAPSVAAYESYVDAIVAGLGDSRALVLVEPDSLGLVPNTSNCSPAGAPASAEADRYTMLNYAVDALNKDANARSYLDGTHSGWQSVGDASERLVRAGVLRADGLFLNVSAYQFTSNEVYYGTWVSDCIAYATQVAPGDFGGCPNQYWNGGPSTNWQGTALSAYGVWTPNNATLALNPSAISERYAGMLGSVQPTAHFVIDTSRNGNGPWDFVAAGYPSAAVAQDWCNPPGRAAGPAPQLNPVADNPLVDAYLWVKVNGTSDGQCNRSVAGSTTDPEWGGIVDPAAGVWFPQMALQLARNAH